jgi:hypothetical protein
MRRWFLGSLLVCGLAAPALALANTSVGVSVSIGNAPPPPVMVIREQPRVIVVPGSSVYVVDDDYDLPYDMFRYGVYWYVYNNDYWYRARSYRGPFTVVEARYVPRPIWGVPAREWRHHPHGGPPGQMKKRWVASDDDDDRGHGHGRGRGHGRD